MVERRIELDRRYVRKKKKKKLKAKLETATGEAREKLLYNNAAGLSPFWTEPAAARKAAREREEAGEEEVKSFQLSVFNYQSKSGRRQVVCPAFAFP